MKKQMIFLVAFALLLVGCGEKKLTCTLDETDVVTDMPGFGKTEVTVVHVFNRSEDELLRTEYTAVLNATNDVEYAYEFAKEDCERDGTLAGVSCTVTRDGNQITTKTTILHNELDGVSRALFGFEGTLSEVRRELVLNGGFGCRT